MNGLEKMADLKYVTYCGLYCRLCATLARVPDQAATLRDTLRKEGWEIYGEYCMPGFKGFWEVLEKYAATGETCPGCRGGCGDPDCTIRICARERGVELCPHCPDFPCDHIEALAKRYPNLIPDGNRMNSIGIDAWIEEQDQRLASGFCYADIRYPDAGS